MVISIVVAYTWVYLQLIILGSLARTVRIRTVRGVGGRFVSASPLTVVLQASWTGLFAPLLGMSALNWSGSPPMPSIRSRRADETAAAGATAAGANVQAAMVVHRPGTDQGVGRRRL